MTKPEPISVCACCAGKFIPNIRQLGQVLRGHRLYCSSECMTKDHKARNAAWWRTDEGREYQRLRLRRVRAAFLAARERRRARLLTTYRKEIT